MQKRRRLGIEQLKYLEPSQYHHALLPRSHLPAVALAEVIEEEAGEFEQEVKKKSRKDAINFTDDQERELGEWLCANPMFYDKGCKAYKDTRRKQAAVHDKCQEMGIDADDYKTWYHSMRSAYGKLSRKEFGSGAKEFTTREKWILSMFSFFKDHIVRHESRQLGHKPKSQTEANHQKSNLDLEDESDVEKLDVDMVLPEDEGDGQQPAATSTPSNKKNKQKQKLSTTNLEELVERLAQRELREAGLCKKVEDLVKAAENHHTAFANFMGSMHQFIHPDLWEEYVRSQFDNLMHYVATSKVM